MQREISCFLKMQDIEYIERLPLSKISTVKIGNIADFVVYPNTEEKLLELVSFLENSKTRYKILGRTSNILPSDERYEGVIIRTDKISGYEFKGNYLSVSTGMSLPNLAKILLKAGHGGFETLSGIPGSIGGSLLGNAGAFGSSVSDFLISVRVYDIESKKTVILSKEECGFSYRSSLLKEKAAVILSADFLLPKTDSSLICLRMQECLSLRKSTQPVDLPSLGSTFRRPSGKIAAAKLIDDCGLRGYRIGGAEVSTKHAGFIVNIGNATAKDYLTLSDYVAECVFNKFGIHLEREIEVL